MAPAVFPLPHTIRGSSVKVPLSPMPAPLMICTMVGSPDEGSWRSRFRGSSSLVVPRLPGEGVSVRADRRRAREQPRGPRQARVRPARRPEFPRAAPPLRAGPARGRRDDPGAEGPGRAGRRSPCPGRVAAVGARERAHVLAAAQRPRGRPQGACPARGRDRAGGVGGVAAEERRQRRPHAGDDLAGIRAIYPVGSANALPGPPSGLPRVAVVSLCRSGDMLPPLPGARATSRAPSTRAPRQATSTTRWR